MSRHFEKKVKSNSHWSVTITSETANLDQSECRKINSHLEIYTNAFYVFFKMAAHFSVVSGHSKRRGKCENLEKIAFQKRQKATKYGL